MRVKQKLVLGFVLISIILNALYVGAEDAVKIGDTIYAGELTSEDAVTIRELDNNDKIDFLVNGQGYLFEVTSNKPEALDLKLQQTGNILTVNIGRESELVLADGSKVFVKYIEFSRLSSKLTIRTDVVGGSTTNSQSEAASEQEGSADETQETAETTDTESATQAENVTEQEESVIGPKTLKSLGSFSNWFVILVVVVLIVVVALIVYYSTRNSD